MDSPREKNKNSMKRYIQRMSKKATFICNSLSQDQLNSSSEDAFFDFRSDEHFPNKSYDGLDIYHPFDFPPLTRSQLQSNLDLSSLEEQVMADTSSETLVDSNSDQTLKKISWSDDDLEEVNEATSERSEDLKVGEADDWDFVLLEDPLKPEEVFNEFYPPYSSTPLPTPRLKYEGGCLNELVNQLHSWEERTSSGFQLNSTEQMVLGRAMPRNVFQAKQEDVCKTRKRKREDEESNKENNPKKDKVRRIRSDKKFESKPHCEFCKENGESSVIYNHHQLKDVKGRTLCPVLRQIVCKICGADGDDAHLPKDCPRSYRASKSLSKSRFFYNTLNIIQRKLKNIKL